MKRFKTGDIIRHKKEMFECICSDIKLAIFAKIKILKDCEKTDFKKLFCVANNMTDDGFVYKYIKNVK